MSDGWGLYVVHLYFFNKKLRRKLAWSAEETSNTDLESEKESVIPITKTLFDLGNGLNSIDRLLGKVVKP